MNDIDQTTVIEEPVDPVSGPSPVVVALAVVGALLAGALLWFSVISPLLGGEEAADESGTMTTGTEDAPGSVETVPPADQEDAEEQFGGDELPLVTFEVFLARDPFDPVIPEPVAEVDDPTETSDPATSDGGNTDGADPDDPSGANGGGDPAEEDGTSAPGGTSGPGNGSADASGDGSGVRPAPDGCTDADEPVCDGRLVSLVEVAEVDGQLVARVQVDSTIYEVRAGDTFAGNFLVQSVRTDGVTLVFGDDVVRLAEGERILK